MNLLDNETAHSSSGQQPKLPVLFHLLDVSRPRSAPLAATLPADCVQATEPAELPHAPTPVKLPPVAPLLSEPTPTIAQTECAPPIVAEQPVAVDAVLATEAPLRADAAEPLPARSQPERRRKPKTPVSEEWFATHGKYIAIVFVVALAATIYFARTNRRTPPVANSDPPPLNIEPGDSAQASSDYRPNTAKGSTTVVADNSLAVGTNPTSPARLIETASANSPQAELFPPTIPSLAASGDNKPSADTPPSASQTAPSLVAARSDVPEANSLPLVQTPADSSAAASTGVPAPSPAAPAPPALEPSYPTTGYPTTGLPAANYPTTNPPPQPTYPVTTYQPAFPPQPSSQMSYPPQMPMQQPPMVQPAPVQSVAPALDTRSAFVPPTTTWTQPNWQAPPPPGGQPAYSPSVNPAPGTRYERSGSGLYQGLR